MKTLNFLNSKFFTLLSVFAFTIFLSSCGKEDLTEDLSMVSENKVATLATESINTPSDVSDFKSMKFNNEKLPIVGKDVLKAKNATLLNGELSVASTGEVNGSLSVVSPDKSINGIVSFENGVFSYKTDKATVKMNLLNDEGQLTTTINGKTQVSKIDFFEATEGYIDYQNNVSKSLSVELQAVGAFLAIINTENWSANAAIAKNLDVAFRGFWCQAAAYGAAAAMAALGAGVCFAITGGCAAGTAVTFGGLAVPCSVLVGLCAGGTFAGTAAAYEAVKNWLC